MTKFKSRRKLLWSCLFCLFILAGSLLPATAVFADSVSIYVSPSSQSVDNGASFTAGIAINTDVPSRGWQLNVNFDASKMSCNSVTEGNFLLDYATAHGGGTIPAGVVNINNTTGFVTIPGWAITGAGESGPTGTGILCTLSFTAKSSINDYASINPVDVIVSDVNGTEIPGVTVAGGQVAIGDVPVPDLVVYDITPVPVTPGSEDYNINFTIKNLGNMSAGASSVSIVIDSGTPIIMTCSELDPGASETLTVSGGPFTLSGGSDNIVITADSSDVVAEGNESNNIKTVLYSLVGDNGDTVIMGNPETTMIITVPEDATFGNLHQGSNTITGTLNIKCNTGWQVSVSDENSVTNGHMTEYDGAAYLTRKLITPMDVRNTIQSNTITLAGPGTIATGDTSGQDGDNGQDFTINFDQIVQYADPALSGGHIYRIVVTFTGAVTF
jgi:hypothetical protein